MYNKLIMKKTTQLELIIKIFKKEDRSIQLNEIYEKMLDYEPDIFKGETPLRTITRIMNGNSIQSADNKTSYKNNKFLFDRVAPSTWKLLEKNIAKEALSIIFDMEEYTEEERIDSIERLLRRKRTNPKLRQWIIDNFPNECQLCRKTTFEKRDGELYFEVHHIKPLSKDGKDEVENLSKLCANCHRKSHYSKDYKNIEKTLKEKTHFLLNELE